MKKLLHVDMHVHSRYSMASARDADLQSLALWARRKGIEVVGTGDFTHPQWFRELEQGLVEAEPGVYRPRDDLERSVSALLPAACTLESRFLLTAEISTVYRKQGRGRRVHHVVCVPGFEAADRVSRGIARFGKLSSDGRPVLRLDSRDLLEIVLGAGGGSFLVPAHIWTPWFSMLGSRSGFDSVGECYGDLASEIFAVETGLSSDPAMNRRLSMLDRLRMVSSSDAHSPAMLGREAWLYEGTFGFGELRRALEHGEGYVGTIEFFPEEGKYHLDGHRKCGVRMEPRRTRAAGGLCPVCGRKVTVGVAYRVEELADRVEPASPPTQGQTRYMVPLAQIASQVLGVGTGSKRVRALLDAVAGRLGPELHVLESAPIEDVAAVGGTRLGMAVRRLRSGAVVRDPGFDGQYGTIRLIEPSSTR